MNEQMYNRLRAVGEHAAAQCFKELHGQIQYLEGPQLSSMIITLPETGAQVTVSLYRSPSDRDWKDCYDCAFETVGLVTAKAPSSDWKHRILNARHSPIRELLYKFRFDGIPYDVAMHLRTHSAGVNPYIRSQRNDRQSNYNRHKAPQDAPVSMRWTLNAEALMNVCNKRECELASIDTSTVVRAMALLAEQATPEFKGLLVPMCEYHGGICREMKPCGKYPYVE